MRQSIRLALAAFTAIFLAGCQTVSLEDAAPKNAPVNFNPVDTGAAATETTATGSEPVSETAGTVETAAAEPKQTVIRRNPGITSVVPIEKTTPVEKKDFVAQGASRTGQYPTFGPLPETANAQITTSEKAAAEAQMAKLLRARANTPDARARYEARLRELRALAQSHATDTQKQIEN